MAEIYGFLVGSTTYQYDYDHLANKPTEIPTWDEDDDTGKLLTVNSTGDQLKWADPPETSSLPDYENQSEGDVLMLVSGQCGLYPVWGQLLPAYSNEDEGKVLAVAGCDGGLEWITVGDSEE